MFNPKDREHLLRMAIADALRSLRKGDETQAAVTLEDALDDVFSEENIGFLGGEVEEEEDLPVKDNVSTGKQKKGSRGWVQLKYIEKNGKSYGPYAYRRWWEGKRCRSEYIGKVKK